MARPRAHYRRILTKQGYRLILINPNIRKKRKKKKSLRKRRRDELLEQLKRDDEILHEALMKDLFGDVKPSSKFTEAPVKPPVWR